MDFHNKEILKRYARMATGRPFAPILLNILITSVCDMRCVHCFFTDELDDKARKKLQMTTREIERLVAQALRANKRETVRGVTVDPKLFEAASMLGCVGNAQFYRVVLPAALPSIFTGLRLGLGLAWFVIVVGEMTGVPQGLGAVIMDGRTLSRTELVICGMIIIGIAGFISDAIVIMVGKRLLRWSPTHG